MANQQHVFFYAPTWDYPPDGPIKLGNVITSVKKPEYPLYCVPPQDNSGISSTKKNNVQYTKEKLRSGRFSVLTKFLSVLGFGIDIAAEVNKSDKETFSFKTIETTQFIPTASYFQGCVDSDYVRRFLHLSRYRKPIYIITGIKVVTGIEANTFKSRTFGSNVSVEVDGTVWSGGTAPIGGGPGVEGKVGSKAITKWDGGDDFVFAFRVSKVFADKTTGQVVSQEEYRKGAMLHNQEQQVQGPDLSILKIENPDAAGEGFSAEDLMEDEDVVICAIPTRKECDD